MAMEPIGALSIAAAVVQFVDLGSRIVKGAIDTYKSASDPTIRSHELDVISKDLSRLLHDVESKLRKGRSSYTALATPRDAESSDDLFPRLCGECREIHGALERIFAKLVPKGESRLALAGSSFVVELKRISAAGEIDRLSDQLNQVRQQATMAALCLLLDESRKNGINIRQFAQQQANIAVTLGRVDQTTQNFSTDLADMVRARPVRGHVDMDKMIRYVLSDQWDASDYVDYNEQGQPDLSKEDDYSERIRRSLFFGSMSYRWSNIPEQYAQTFEWIFKEPRTSEDGQLFWHSFPKWLEGDSDDIFWITGKPGAGKSTLLKFIARDPRFEHFLSHWAEGAQLLIGSFFSWSSGPQRLQKTHEGLLKTLLFEILKQDKSLAARVFPGRWCLLQLFDGEVDLPKIEYNELIRAFRALLSATSKSLKLALVIDALDEFEEDHNTLISLLREANTKPWVKICVSSRPWNVFKDEYIKNPTLQLEKLTHDDMELYVRERFQNSPGFDEFQVTNRPMAATIINDIVEKAQGVFLWVSIVSGLLEENFREGCGPADLQAVFDSLPGEVSQLFMYIWDRTNVKFRKEASQYFQVMRVYEKRCFTPYCLTFCLGEYAVPADMKAADLTSEYVSNAIGSLSRKLMSRTGGLLEIFGDPTNTNLEERRVDFMHRTAADWVAANWDTIASSAGEDFDPNLWVLKGDMLRILRKADLGHFQKVETHKCFWEQISHLIALAALVRDTIQTRAILVGILDRLDEQLSKWSELGPGNDTLHKDPWYNRLLFGTTRTHWIRRLNLFDGTLDFLSYTARYPIAPYIKFKLEEDPKVFSTQHGRLGIWENMVFGPCLGLPPSSFFKPNLTLSLDLAESLLQQSVCLDQVKKARDLAIKLKAQDIYAPNTPHYKYLTSMADLLNKYVPRDETDVGLRRRPLLFQIRNLLRHFGQSA